MMRDTFTNHGTPLMTLSERVNSAIDGIKTVDSAYWENTLKQRLPGTGAGSIVDGFKSPEALETALREAKWHNYASIALQDGTVGFKTGNIMGRLGVIALSELKGDEIVTLDDRKNTGMVSATIQGVLGDQVDFTVIILGIENGVEVAFTFHPGDVVSPSKVPATQGLHGKAITVAEAMKMGLTTAKIVA